jgi:uncharacterized protein YjaZ
LKATFKIIITLTIFNSVSCTEPTKPAHHKIIFLHNYFSPCADSTKTLVEKQKAYTHLWNYFFKQYFSDCTSVNTTIKDSAVELDPTDYTFFFNHLKKTISEIDQHRAKIETTIQSALIKCNEDLHLDSVILIVVPIHKDTNYYKHLTVSGITLGHKHIVIGLDPQEINWEELKSTVAHEYHHAYFFLDHKNIIYDPILLDRIVTEGKAEKFSQIVYPDIPPSFVLSWKELITLWKEVKPNLTNKNYYYQNLIMFGNKKYPFCGGYALGHDMVNQAIEKVPTLNIKEWTNLTSDSILKLSRYK